MIARKFYVSVLFNESKLLKFGEVEASLGIERSFSTLQRVEIAEMFFDNIVGAYTAEVSVLFNESKLLKSTPLTLRPLTSACFSTLQRVEIAEITCSISSMMTSS